MDESSNVAQEGVAQDSKPSNQSNSISEPQNGNSSNIQVVNSAPSEPLSGRKASAARRSEIPLPAASAFALADILRSIDRPEIQVAINGIAEIYQKNLMTFPTHHGGAYAFSTGEITPARRTTFRSSLFRPGNHRVLTSVPEASSSSSGSHRTGSVRRSLFAPTEEINTPRKIRIGTMGRFVAAGVTTMLTTFNAFSQSISNPASNRQGAPAGPSMVSSPESQAISSLQNLLREPG